MIHALIRVTNPIVWAVPRNVARKLRHFALVEAESVLEMRAAASLTEDPARRALYLQHALDEARHARVFARAATGIDGRSEPTHVAPEDLFERLGEARFLAFVHLGERRGRLQFESYRDHFSRRNSRLAGLFDGLLTDERRHEAYTRELLVNVLGSEAATRRALRWATAWDAWRRWVRAGRAVAGVAYVSVMMAVYVALTPIACIVRLTLPARTGLRPAKRP